MPRYVAFLRGVSPVNASMPALEHCFEGAGVANVCTVLSSGNVVFDARAASDASLARKAEAARHRTLRPVTQRHPCRREFKQSDIGIRPTADIPARAESVEQMPAAKPPLH